MNIFTRIANIFRRQPQKTERVESAFQIRERNSIDYLTGGLINTGTLYYKKYSVFEKIREAIPMINRSVLLYTRLVGTFEVVSEDDRVKKEIQDFCESVEVNDLQRGMYQFIKQLVDGYVLNGMSWAEEIPSSLAKEIARLRVAPIELLRFKRDDTTGRFAFAQTLENGTIELIPIQEYVHYMAHNQRDGDPHGYSLFESAPFVSQILVRIFTSIDNAFTRVGDPSFFVEFEVKDDTVNEADVKKSMTSIKTALKDLFKKRMHGQTGDIVAPIPAGVKAKITTIGADGQTFDMQIPVDTIISQLESATGLPGFLLGVYAQGATGFKISTHQADIITQNVNDIRVDIDNVIKPIIDRHLILKGYLKADYDLEWHGVSLMDEVEKARAVMLEAQAKKFTVEYLTQLVDSGRMTDEAFQQELVERDIVTEESAKGLSKEQFVIKSLMKIAENKHV